MTQQYIVQPKKGLGLKLKKGQILKVVDVEGQQVADFVAYHAKDFYEHLDQGATIDANHSIHVKVNDHIYSNLYKPMLTLIEDTVGKHDLLLPACRPDMNRLLYGKQKDEFQDTCYDNMNRALEQFGVPKPHMHYPFAIFMNTVLDEKGICLWKRRCQMPGITSDSERRWIWLSRFLPARLKKESAMATV